MAAGSPLTLQRGSFAPPRTKRSSATAKRIAQVVANRRIASRDAAAAFGALTSLSSDDRVAATYELGPDRIFRLTEALPSHVRSRYSRKIAQLEGQFFGHLHREAKLLGVQAADDSRRFAQVLGAVKAGTADFPRDQADRYAYLFVPGLMTEHQLGYFDDNLAFMEAHGLTSQVSGIDTDAGIETNGPVVRREIEALHAATGKPVIVIAHSKGVADSVHAIKGQSVEARVAALLPMQGAFGGTPVADEVNRHAGSLIARVLEAVLGAPDGRAVSDLGFETTNRLFNPRGGTLEVPVFSFVSDDEGRERNILDTLSSRMRDVYRVASDGLVPLESQIVPGPRARFAKLTGLHHADSVQLPALELAQADVRPAEITRAQLTWALEALGKA